MKAFLYKCSISFIFCFIILSGFILTAHANQFGTMCYEVYGGSTDLSQYCNTNTGFTDIGAVDASYGTGTATAIQQLSRMNIFFGYPQSDCGVNNYPCFRPNNHITRWEVAAAISRYHIYIKRDWYSWDAANDPIPNQTNPDGTKCDCIPPVKNFDGTFLADVKYWDPGDSEMHNSLLHRWFRGSTCDTFYQPQDPNNPITWNDPNNPPIYIGDAWVTYTQGNMVYDPYHNENVRDKSMCFGPQGDWVFGFHGVERADAAYMYYTINPINTPIANHRFYYCNYFSPIQSGPGSCEEAWNGQWYKFAEGGDAPYYMTRAAFAKELYQYYLDVDNNNYCGSTASGIVTGSALIADPDNPGKQMCVIHANESSCSTPISYTTSHVFNNTCNYPTLVYNNSVVATGASGSVQSADSTGPSDIKYYGINYLFELNQSYISGWTFTIPIGGLGFYGRRTSGTISFPGGPCAIPSASTTCSQPISWTTDLISDPNTVVLKDTTNNVVLSPNGTSGGTNYVISGPTTITLYENGVALDSQTVTPTKQRTISGTVMVDYNDNVAVDTGDGPFTTGVVVTLSTGATTTSAADGSYSFANVPDGSYTLSLPASINSPSYPDGLHPSSYALNPLPITVAGADVTQDLHISPYYQITGGVFVDTDKNGKKSGGESYYSGGAITVTSSGGGTISYPVSGTFTIARLAYGQQTISYTSNIPNGYVITYPSVGAGSPTYTVQVGKTCAVTPVTPAGGDGTCAATGNISNLNFGISNSTPWIQGFGFDMRFDGGLGNGNQIPSLSNSCGEIYTMMPTNAADATTHGGVYIGSSSRNNSFGVRQTPSKNAGWVIDTEYPETYKPVVSGIIRTSYSYLLGGVTRANITQTELSTINGCSDPSISCSLVNLSSGVYTHTGDIVLSALTIPANRNVILLSKGNLSITGDISVPTTSTLTVSVGDNAGGTAGNITVASSIGSAPACVPPTGQIQGFFTADKNITINGIDDCTVSPDTMLTIEGAIVVNASLNGGTFSTNRDLCANDVNYPAVMIKERPDFIFHAPDVIKQQNYLFRELAP